ncbi:MAG TPA: class I SAM-dependent methyltransferase [Candidatus Gracilibacteria bacterium]
MFQAMRDFWNRRVRIPANWESLVLDVGSGEKPHWRADVLCDLYPEASFSHHRAGGGSAQVTAPLVVGNAEDLPFKDKVFDFVIASNLLEHVPDPGKACSELQRVAKAGYIELPYEGLAKMNDLESHLWWCREEGRRIVFTPKVHMQFDPEIYSLTKELINRRVWFQKVVHPNFDLTTVRFWWIDGFDFEVKGKAHEALQKEIAKLEAIHNKSARNRQSRSLKIMRFALKVLFWHKTRKEPFDLKALLKCPQSGEETLQQVSPNLYRGKDSGEIIRVLTP